MDSRNLAGLAQVSETLAAWRTLHAELAQLEIELKEKTASCSEGKGRFPDELFVTVQELRLKSAGLLDEAVHSLERANAA